MDPNQSHNGKARLFLFNTSNKDDAVRSLLTCASSKMLNKQLSLKRLLKKKVNA